MNGLYEFLEQAVNWSNILYSLIFALVGSFIIGLITFSVIKSMMSGIYSFVASLILIVVLFFLFRDNVHSTRIKEINKAMSSIEYVYRNEDFNKGISISNWREGLEFIKKNPTEVGLYLRTVKFFEEDRDFESAATLIEFGLDRMNYDKIPIIICDKLQLYYSNLPNRPKLDSNCNKIHDL